MAENTAPTAVADDAAVEDDGLYRFVDSDGRKRATSRGSRVQLEHQKSLAAAEKLALAEEEAELDVAPVVATEKLSPPAVVESPTSAPTDAGAKPAAAKGSPAKADPKV